jgi:hypothetical protein
LDARLSRADARVRFAIVRFAIVRFAMARLQHLFREWPVLPARFAQGRTSLGQS